MTERSYREEAVEPRLDMVALVRARRLRWLGHVLRAEESYLLKKVVVDTLKTKRRVAILPDPSSWTHLTTGLLSNCWLWLKIGKLGNYM